MLAGLILPAPAKAQIGLGTMKLLTPTTGWVSKFGHLYWTTDSGSHWKDITPVPPGVFRAGVNLQGVFFLNTREGWAAVYLPGKPVSLVPQPGHQNTLYDVAHTVDAGKTWSFSSFTFPELSYDEEEALSGLRGLFFLDSRHGWLIPALTGNSQPGDLVATDDGGKTWGRAHGVGTSGVLRFTSLKDGWFLGGPVGRLFATHDGCKTWQELDLKTELQGKTVGCGPLGLPHFTGESHGYVAASCMGQAVVAFATEDAGRTWKAVKKLSESQRGGEFPVAIADSTLIVPTGEGTKGFKTAAIPLHGATDSPVIVSRSSALALAFADRSHGLTYAINGRLFYTSDGGAAWKDVTPWPMPKRSPLPPGITVRHPKTEMEVKHLGSSPSNDQQAPPHRH